MHPASPQPQEAPQAPLGTHSDPTFDPWRSPLDRHGIGPYATVIADSTNRHGTRLTTLEVTMPRWILAQFNTHGILAKNSASSRAIPTHKIIEAIQRNPCIPYHVGRNQPGMSADEEVPPEERAAYIRDMLDLRDMTIGFVQQHRHVHKQVRNRHLEPWMWHTVLVTGTEWANLYALRLDAHAQPEFQVVARRMLDAMDASTPKRRLHGDWHLPFITDEERGEYNFWSLLAASVARCARVSYLNHHGVCDIATDIGLANKLVRSGHMSPTQHQARCQIDKTGFSGQFRGGWQQHRKQIPGEAVFNKDAASAFDYQTFYGGLA